MNRKGLNRADKNEYIIFESSCVLKIKDFSSTDPCIFISHKKEDKEQAVHLVNYIKDAGIDVYFDEDDAALNNPAVLKSASTVTIAINKALERSTHMIALISNKTKESWWVPYEIGFACNKSSFFSNSIRVLFIKGFAEITPEYLQIINKIKSITELDIFLKQVSKASLLLNEEKVRSFSRFLDHPLKNILI